MAHLYFITEVIFIKPTKNCIREIKYLFTRISVLSFRWIFAVFVLRGWKWISSEDGDSKDQLISSLADFILHLMSHLSEKFVNCYLVYKQLALQTRSNLMNGTCTVQKKININNINNRCRMYCPENLHKIFHENIFMAIRQYLDTQDFPYLLEAASKHIRNHFIACWVWTRFVFWAKCKTLN